MSERVKRLMEEMEREKWNARFTRETLTVGVAKDFPETVTVRA